MINSYNTLPVGKYLEIRNVLKEDMEELELQTNIISILNDISVEDVLNLPVVEYSKKVNESAFLMERPNISAKCPSKLVFGKNEYYVMKNLNKINAAQFIDYNTYMKQEDPDGLIDKVLSIFIIPIGKKYNTDYDIEAVQEDIKENLPIQTALEICFFFRLKQIKSLEHMLIYLELMMKMKKAPVEKKEEIQKALEMLRQMEVLRKDLDGSIR